MRDARIRIHFAFFVFIISIPRDNASSNLLCASESKRISFFHSSSHIVGNRRNISIYGLLQCTRCTLPKRSLTALIDGRQLRRENFVPSILSYSPYSKTSRSRENQIFYSSFFHYNYNSITMKLHFNM